MGYRSNVEIVVYGEPETFDAFIAGMKLIKHRVFEDWDWANTTPIEFVDKPHYNSTTITKIMSFKVDDVKWYDDYDAIRAWERDFLPKAEDAGLNWEMVRVGEESDDINHECGGDEVDYLLYTITSIERNF